MTAEPGHADVSFGRGDRRSRVHGTDGARVAFGASTPDAQNDAVADLVTPHPPLRTGIALY